MKKTSFSLTVLILILVSLGLVASVEAQERVTSLPPISINCYTRCTVKVTFPKLNYISSGEIISPDTGSTYMRDTEALDAITITWSTNSSNIWTIDLYINYSIPMTMSIDYTIDAHDTMGLPTGSGPHTAYLINQQNVWIRFQVTTRPAPRYPTIEEEMAWMLQPGNPYIQRMDRLDYSIFGEPELEGEGGLIYAVEKLTFWAQVGTIAAIIVILALVVLIFRK